MFKLTQLVTFREGGDRNPSLLLLSEASKASEVVRSACLPTMLGVYNGGDLIWHVQFESEERWRAWDKACAAKLENLPNVTHVDSVAYEGGPEGAARRGLT